MNNIQYRPIGDPFVFGRNRGGWAVANSYTGERLRAVESFIARCGRQKPSPESVWRVIKSHSRHARVMPDFPIESLTATAARIQSANSITVDSPPCRVNRRDAYTNDAIVRQEFGFADAESLDDVTINHYGPGTNQTINSLLVPVAGGPNSRAAVELASNIASEWAASITLLTIIAEDTTDDQRLAAGERLDTYTEIVGGSSVAKTLVRSNDVVSTIATESDAHELLVIGASEQSLFKRLFSGSIPDKLRQETHAPIFIVSQ